MSKIVKKVFLHIILFLRPVLSALFLRDLKKVASYEIFAAPQTASGMVSEFGFLHRLIYLPFFKRAKYIENDIAALKNVRGPIVFISKNRGQLEYRFFNYLFLKEKIPLVSFATNSVTYHWWPWRSLYRLFVWKLKELYEKGHAEISQGEQMAARIKHNENVLLNLTISRDYLFGVIRTDPLESLSPLIRIQKELALPLHIVTFQFLYDKHPDKSERSYFDLLFGEKSTPGAIRKFLLLLINYRRTPQVKFGEPLNLQDFLLAKSHEAEVGQSQSLLAKIEEDLRIEKARITGPRSESKDHVITAIMDNPHFLERIQALAQESGSQPEAVKDKARGYLQEIAADTNYSYVQFAHVTLGYVWNNIYDGVVVKHEQLGRVREVAGKNPVVLVPMHRSHIDYLLISDIFYQNNITFPHVCGGINLNFWPVGGFIRKCGGFFIRRQFHDNKLYKETLSAYINHLIAKGYCLEFFIEGTRSRMGKMLKPKMGILNMILSSFFAGGSPDIYFVPIAITYDQIAEQKVYQKEGLGVEKKRENVGELLKTRRLFSKRYGKVYIEFADPISLRDYLRQHDFSVDSVVEDDLRNAVNQFAYYLTYQMNKIALVTPMALVSTALLTLNKRSLGIDELLKTIDVLKDYLDYKQVNFSDLINYSDQYAYNEAIRKLVNHHILKEVQTFEEGFFIFDDKQRATLDYYKNNILHFFASLTCFCKVLLLEEKNTFSLNEATQRFETVKTLFRQDFTFSERKEVRDHVLKVIQYGVTTGWIAYDELTQMVTVTGTLAANKDFVLFSALLDNFLESQFVALRYFRTHTIVQQDEKSLIKEILGKARPMYLKEDLKHPEALSRFNLEGALKVFVEIGILKTQDKSGTVLYSSTDDQRLLEQWIELLHDLLLTPGIKLPHPAAHKSGEEKREELH